ncbi:GMC family oxidoreductase [Marinomonas algicola]|uniref:GMC family oxidoreductase n=1 Tax=Marinomonas algicola TaxID=2773454 RepID=UPI001748FF51|nr:GMC family oxidoreductase [Marinomonas algicola]
MRSQYKYIVVGGGSAGAVAAARLAKKETAGVLLLEGGYSHKHPLLDMPAGIFKMINGSKYMRYYHTTPQAHLGGRVHDIPQGNVLGGGSSVNAQVYMRGRASDYNEWQQILGGDAQWGWEHVLPYFKEMESNNRLLNEYHGASGPVQVSDPQHIDDSSRAFVQSVQAQGIPFNDDFNGVQQKGVGFYQFTNRNGRRSSTAYAFLGGDQTPNNLEIQLQCRVHKVLIEEGAAVGVIYENESGDVLEARLDNSSAGEVILAAGALITPKLLMLSGVGCAKQLEQHGIRCLVDLPGVGENLIDHPEVPIIATAKKGFGYFKQGEGWRMWRNGLQFALFGSGPVTSAGVEAGAFVNPTSVTKEATIQAFCVPMVYLDRDVLNLVNHDYGMTITTVVVKPVSRGYVRLASSNANDQPLVCPNLLKEEADLSAMIEGQRFFIKSFQTPPLANSITSIVIPDINSLSDACLAEHCRKTVKTNYHPAGTCKMGAAEDPMAVLNNRLQVKGIKGLRVCDMSAVPNINAGNTNAVAMMLGQRCADFILADDN